MKRLVFASILALMSSSAFAASQGFQQSASISSASAITPPSIPSVTQSVLVYVEGTAGIRWRDDGTDPTTTVGNPVSSGQAFCYAGDVKSLRLIGQAAGATVNFTYYGGTCR